MPFHGPTLWNGLPLNMSVVYSFCSRSVFLAIFISNIHIFVNNFFLTADHRLIPAVG